MGNQEDSKFHQLKHPEDDRIEKLIKDKPDLLRHRGKSHIVKMNRDQQFEDMPNFVNIDFYEWLRNKSLQTDIYVEDHKKFAQNIIAEYRKQPGPG